MQNSPKWIALWLARIVIVAANVLLIISTRDLWGLAEGTALWRLVGVHAVGLLIATLCWVPRRTCIRIFALILFALPPLTVTGMHLLILQHFDWLETTAFLILTQLLVGCWAWLIWKSADQMRVSHKPSPKQERE